MGALYKGRSDGGVTEVKGGVRFYAQKANRENPGGAGYLKN